MCLHGRFLGDLDLYVSIKRYDNLYIKSTSLISVYSVAEQNMGGVAVTKDCLVPGMK